MLRPKNSIPEVRRHKHKQLGYLELSGETHYLGYWPEGMKRPPLTIVEAADAIIAEWIAGGRRPLSEIRQNTITIDSIIVAFLNHGKSYYRHPDGTPTRELDNFRHALRPVHREFGSLPTCDFSTRELRTVREGMIRRGLARTTINARIRRICTVFRWAADEGMIDPVIATRLSSLRSLKQGKCEAAEAEPVQGVADAVVTKTLTELTPTTAAMVRLQQMTGMRPGEVCRMRADEIDRRGEVWIYSPIRHKTKHRGKSRIIPLGPKCQEILTPLLIGVTGFIFLPSRALEEHRAARRKVAKSRSATADLTRVDRDREVPYTTTNYAQAIRRAAIRAECEPWSPNQLRHSFSTMIRRKLNLESAQKILGHSSPRTTEIYAKDDLDAIVAIAKQFG